MIHFTFNELLLSALSFVCFAAIVAIYLLSVL